MDISVVIIITILFAGDFLIVILVLPTVLMATIDLVPLFSVDVSGPTVVPLSGAWLIGLRPGMSRRGPARSRRRCRPELLKSLRT